MPDPPQPPCQTSSARSAPLRERPPRLLLLTSHAIQYQAPLLRAMAKDPRFEISVALCSDQGARPYRDQGFAQEVKWDIPLLQGYDYQILRNYSPVPNPSRFWGLINPGIIRLIWSGNFDALLIHSWSNVTTWLAVFAAWAKGMPMLLKPEANIHSPTRPWKVALKRWVLSRLFRKMCAILASGRLGVEFFQHYGVPTEKLVVAPYAVDNEFFIAQAEAQRPARAELRKRLGVNGDIPLIVFVGKLYPGKRPFDLLRAFALVRKQARAALVFVGDGEQRDELEEWAKAEGVPDVQFAGFRNQTELPGFLAAANVFVLPSQLETWGLVVNEAMCFSLPVVVTDRVGAGADLVRHGSNGYVYPVGDVEALAHHLAALAGDTQLRRRMGEESFRIIQKWSYRENLDALATCLARLIPVAQPTK